MNSWKWRNLKNFAICFTIQIIFLNRPQIHLVYSNFSSEKFACSSFPVAWQSGYAMTHFRAFILCWNKFFLRNVRLTSLIKNAASIGNLNHENNDNVYRIFARRHRFCVCHATVTIGWSVCHDYFYLFSVLEIRCRGMRICSPAFNLSTVYSRHFFISSFIEAACLMSGPKVRHGNFVYQTVLWGLCFKPREALAPGERLCI